MYDFYSDMQYIYLVKLTLVDATHTALVPIMVGFLLHISKPTRTEKNYRQYIVYKIFIIWCRPIPTFGS
jgi:hypothetical protein